MAAKKRTATPKGPKVLATLSEEDRIEYIRRYNYSENKRFEALAAASYLDALNDSLMMKYELPGLYDLNLENGKVTERAE